MGLHQNVWQEICSIIVEVLINKMINALWGRFAGGYEPISFFYHLLIKQYYSFFNLPSKYLSRTIITTGQDLLI